MSDKPTDGGHLHRPDMGAKKFKKIAEGRDMTDTITEDLYWLEVQSLRDFAYQDARADRRRPSAALKHLLDAHEWIGSREISIQVLGYSKCRDRAAAFLSPDDLVEEQGFSIRWGELAYFALEGDCLNGGDFDWDEIPKELR